MSALRALRVPLIGALLLACGATFGAGQNDAQAAKAKKQSRSKAGSRKLQPQAACWPLTIARAPRLARHLLRWSRQAGRTRPDMGGSHGA